MAGLGFGLLPTGEIRGGPLLALGADHAVGDQLADRQREVLGGGPELLVDLLDAQARVALHERCKALGQRLEIRRGALGAAASSRTADASAARRRAPHRRPRSQPRPQSLRARGPRTLLPACRWPRDVRAR